MKHDRLPQDLSDVLPLAKADQHRIDLTYDERVTRMCFAVHEAAHFVAACRVELYPFDAYVRVPRKSPNTLSVFRAGGPGVGGLVSVSGTLMQDAVIAAAAVIAQPFLPNDHERIYADDLATIEKWFGADSVPEHFWEMYKSWCEDNGFRSGSKKQFTRRLEDRGVTSSGWQGKERVHMRETYEMDDGSVGPEEEVYV